MKTIAELKEAIDKQAERREEGKIYAYELIKNLAIIRN